MYHSKRGFSFLSLLYSNGNERRNVTVVLSEDVVEEVLQAVFVVRTTLGTPKLPFVVRGPIGVWGFSHTPPVRLFSALVTAVRPEIVFLERMSNRRKSFIISSPPMFIGYI